MAPQLPRERSARCRRRRLRVAAAPPLPTSHPLSTALQVGTAWVLGALQTLAAVVFSTLSPAAPECAKPDDAACRQALEAGGLCGLPRDAWQWRST